MSELKQRLNYKQIQAIQRKRWAETEQRRADYKRKREETGMVIARKTVNETLSNLWNVTEVDPLEFYTAVFQDNLERAGEHNPGEYTAIFTELRNNPDGKRRGRQYNVTDGLPELYSILHIADEERMKHTFFMAPISYAGKKATRANARFLFALAIDLDNLLVDADGTQSGLANLYYHMMTEGDIPCCSYIVSSGNGVHLYYIFDEPIPLYKSNARLLSTFRKAMIRRIWRDFITTTYKQKQIQWESLYQQFRIPGTRTKSGGICRVYKVGNGDPVTIQEMLTFGYWKPDEIEKWNKIVAKPRYSYVQLKEMWPDWTDRHFDKKTHRPLKNPKKKFWRCNEGLYYWFLNRLPVEIEVGHRYYSLLCLAAYAQKCGISKERYVADCEELYQHYEGLNDNPDNPWTPFDQECAIAAYDKQELRTMSVDAVAAYCGIEMHHNKRNGRTRAQHIKIMHQARDVDYPDGSWRGRKTKRDLVECWRLEHPENTNKSQCARDLGISRPTVTKWWD